MPEPKDATVISRVTSDEKARLQVVSQRNDENVSQTVRRYIRAGLAIDEAATDDPVVGFQAGPGWYHAVRASGQRVVLSLALAVVAALGLSACGSSGEPQAAPASTSDVVTDEEATAIVSAEHDAAKTERAEGKAKIHAIEVRVAKGECFSFALGSTGQFINDEVIPAINARPSVDVDPAGGIAISQDLLSQIPTDGFCDEATDAVSSQTLRSDLTEYIAAARAVLAAK